MLHDLPATPSRTDLIKKNMQHFISRNPIQFTFYIDSFSIHKKEKLCQFRTFN